MKGIEELLYLRYFIRMSGVRKKNVQRQDPIGQFSETYVKKTVERK